MAYIYTWPTTLPQQPEKGYAETVGLNILRTPVDMGPAKQRRRSRRPDTLSLQYTLTQAQVTRLDTFILDELDGTTRFGFPHPRKNTVVEARVIPQQSGQLYGLAYLAPGYYRVTLELELLT